MVDLFHIYFDDAHEFLDYLRPSKKHWGNTGRVKQWLFRGQGNEKWKLVPSAWRNIYVEKVEPRDIISDTINQLVGPISDNQKLKRMVQAVKLAYTEFQFINRFVDLADKTGFLLPRLDEWKILSQNFFMNYPKNIVESPTNNKFWEHPIVALAQHHGVPTRLLDWTENALVASYFALLGHNTLIGLDKEHNKRIVVYAIHESLTGNELKKITVSRAENLNLRVQEGLFLYNIKSEEDYIRMGYFPSIDETLLSIQLNHAEIKNPYQKIMLSIDKKTQYEKEIDVLHDLLERENITTAHLMPTLDNVAKAVKSRLIISGG